jgi:hypothetical protein
LSQKKKKAIYSTTPSYNNLEKTKCHDGYPYQWFPGLMYCRKESLQRDHVWGVLADHGTVPYPDLGSGYINLCMC